MIGRPTQTSMLCGAGCYSLNYGDVQGGWLLLPETRLAASGPGGNLLQVLCCSTTHCCTEPVAQEPNNNMLDHETMPG